MFANLRSWVGLRSIDLDRWLPWLVGMAAFVLYASTAAPSIVRFDDDSLEFQLVGPTLGIAHPTGYPLYTLLGGLWSRVIFPVGNWAWRMNLFSAVAGAATVGLVFLLIRRMTRQSGYGAQPLAGLIGAGVFGLGSVWWSQATVAEVYALHGLFTAALLYAAVGLTQQPVVNPDRRMTQLFLLFGLSLTHHRTTLLLAPGLAIYLLWQIPGLWRPRWIWLRWLAALSSTSPPLSLPPPAGQHGRGGPQRRLCEFLGGLLVSSAGPGLCGLFSGQRPGRQPICRGVAGLF